MSRSERGTVAAEPTRRVAALGGGLIGRSWTALFLAAGRSVAVYDPDPATKARVEETVETAWPLLTALGLARTSGPEAELVIVDDPRAAVDGADFVQESIPERVGLKHELYAAVEPALSPTAVVASSASGLTLSELQGGWQDPSRFVLGHPFNPPISSRSSRSWATSARQRVWWERPGSSTSRSAR